MWGFGVGLLQVVPSLVSWRVISLPEIPVCALTVCIVMSCLVHRIWWRIKWFVGVVVLRQGVANLIVSEIYVVDDVSKYVDVCDCSFVVVKAMNRA